MQTSITRASTFGFAGMLLVLGVVNFLSDSGDAQSPQDSNSKQKNASQGIPSGIAWYGVLTDGIAEAKATNRPIFLMSAAPQCAGIPGMW